MGRVRIIVKSSKILNIDTKHLNVSIYNIMARVWVRATVEYNVRARVRVRGIVGVRVMVNGASGECRR